MQPTCPVGDLIWNTESFPKWSWCKVNGVSFQGCWELIVPILFCGLEAVSTSKCWVPWKKRPMWEKCRAGYSRPGLFHPNFWPKSRDNQDRFFFAVGNLSALRQETVAGPEEEPAIWTIPWKSLLLFMDSREILNSSLPDLNTSVKWDRLKPYSLSIAVA